MNVGNFSKHENKSSYSQRDKGNLLTRRVSQINVYAVKRVFQQSSKLKIAKCLINHVLSNSYYVTRFKLGHEWKATEQRRFCVSNNIVIYNVSVNHERMDANNIVSKRWFMRSFPHMNIPESILTSPPNIYPKLVLKNARLDSSFARYTFTFCVTLLTFIVMQVPLWLFPSCMRVFIASTRSIMKEYSPGSR